MESASKETAGSQPSATSEEHEPVATFARVATDALATLPPRERDETYVISFYVSDEEDDPRLPTLTIGTNTEAQVYFVTHQPADFVTPNPWWTPTDEVEARWNYAFWLRNELGVFPASIDQTRQRERWTRSRGLWFEEPKDPGEWDVSGQSVTAFFVTACIDASRQLHTDGVILQLFGRTIPVVIHELEYYDEIADQTTAANPPGVADDFAEWVTAM